MREARDGPNRDDGIPFNARSYRAEAPRTVVERKRPGRIAADGIPVPHRRCVPRWDKPRRQHQPPRTHRGGKDTRSQQVATLPCGHPAAFQTGGPQLAAAAHEPHPAPDEEYEHPPRQDPVRPSEPALPGKIGKHRPVEDRRGATRHHQPRERESDTRALLQPLQCQHDERAPRPADKPPKLRQEREVCADQRADIRDPVKQKCRHQRTRIAEAHSARIRREEPQPGKPDLRAVQDRVVEYKTWPEPPKGESDHGKPRHRPRSPTSARNMRHAHRATVPEPPPDRLQARHEKTGPRLRQKEHRDQRHREYAPDPGMPLPVPTQWQQRTDQRRRVVGVVETEGPS